MLSLIFIPIIILLVIGAIKFLLPLLIIGGIAFLVFAIIRGITRSNGTYPQNSSQDQHRDYRQEDYNRNYQQDYRQNYQQDYRRNVRPDYPQDFIDADYREIK